MQPCFGVVEVSEPGAELAAGIAHTSSFAVVVNVS